MIWRKARSHLVAALAVATVMSAYVICDAAPADQTAEANPASRRPRIGLVLGGGGARGAAHIGVIKVLEEMHIPVDYIVGTSMGSIVGGAYASGASPAEMEKKVGAADWKILLSDRIQRQDRSIYQKQLEREDNVWGLEFGYREGKVLLPRGAVIGSQIELFFGDLVRFYQGSFDDLVIPFRAVATDIGTGDMVVLDRGSLVGAMRGSMSVPGVFSPYPLDNKLLVDGMLVRNLPVDVARKMGADVIIAVNVGSTLLPREKIRDALTVTGQMVAILTEQNVQASLKELGAADVLVDVQPELGDFPTGNFAEAVATIPKGEIAARAVAAKLRRYSVSPEQYLTHRAEQLKRFQVVTVDSVRVDTAHLKFVNPKAVEAIIGAESGGAIKEGPEALDAGLRALASTEDFEKFDYQFEDMDGKRLLSIKPIEKDWGPNYLRFGLEASTNLSGQSSLNALLNYRMTWLNSLGLEWRNNISAGQRTSIESELYQPLDHRGIFFVAPSVFIGRELYDLYVDESPVSSYMVQREFAAFDAGMNLGTAAQIRLGYVGGRGKADPEIASPSFEQVRQRVGAVRASIVYDTFDNWALPRSGLHARASAYHAEEGLGSDTDWNRADVGIDKAFMIGPHRIQLGLAGGSALGTDLPVFEAFPLGGFLRLSGYGRNQFIGQEYAFLRGIYSYELGQSKLVDSAVYIGGSLEAGNVYQRINGPPSTGLKPAASLFLAANTAVGPAFVAFGVGESQNYAIYIFLGRPY
jgi:NTE family protein